MCSLDEEQNTFTIKVKYRGEIVKTISTTETVAYSLLEVFKLSSNFDNRVNKKDKNIYIFELDHQNEIDELTNFINTGVRSLYPTKSIDLNCFGVNIVKQLMSIKPDEDYPKYLILSDLERYEIMRRKELEIRQLFSLQTKDRGYYESADKIHGDIAVKHVIKFEDCLVDCCVTSITKKKFVRQETLCTRNTSVYNKSNNLTYDINKKHSKRLSAKDANAHFMTKIPQQHRHLFTTDPLSNEFCVAGGSLLHSLNFPDNKPYRGDIDIFPLVPSNVEDFVHRFALEIKKTGFVEMSRNSHAININWYPTPLILLRKIFFPWLAIKFADVWCKRLKGNRGRGDYKTMFDDLNADVANIDQIRLVGDSGKIQEQIYQDTISKLNIKSGYSIVDIISDMKKILSENIHIIEDADLPNDIVKQLQDYVSNNLDDVIDMIDIVENYGIEDHMVVISAMCSTNMSTKHIRKMIKLHNKEIVDINDNKNNKDNKNNRSKPNGFWRKYLYELFETGKVQYQIILQRNTCVSEVLARFDVDCCCVAYHSNSIYITDRSQFSLKHNTNVIDPTRQSPSYHHRLLKYHDRDFNIFIPHFERSKVIGKSAKNTLGLSNLVYLYHSTNKLWSLNSANTYERNWYVKGSSSDIIFYDINSLCLNTIEGWTPSGHRAKGVFSSDVMMSETAEMIGSINSKTTPFYFTAYISEADMMYYMSKINILGNVVTKIVDPKMFDTVDSTVDSIVMFSESVENKQLLDAYLDARDNRYTIHEVEINESYMSQLELIKSYECGSKKLSNHEYSMDIFDKCIKCVKEALITKRIETRYTADSRMKSKVFDVYPIISSDEGLEGLDSFITKVVGDLNDCKELNVLSFTRTENYIDIDVSLIFDNVSDIELVKICETFPKETKEFRDDFFLKMDKPLHMPLHFPPMSTVGDNMDISSRRLSSRHKLMLSKLKDIISKKFEDKYRRHDRFRMKKMFMNILERIENSSFIAEDENSESLEIVSIRIHYLFSSSVGEAFDYLQHSHECVGSYNDKVVYNERYKHYVKTGVAVIDPSFRRGPSFEQSQELGIRFVSPYDMSKIKVWRDLRTNNNFHQFILQQRYIYNHEIDIDTAWYDCKGISSQKDHEKRISFNDHAQLTTRIVKIRVGKKSYYINFGKKRIRSHEPLRNYYDCAREYGKMAFLNRDEALIVASKGFLKMDRDRVMMMFSDDVHV